MSRGRVIYWQKACRIFVSHRVYVCSPVVVLYFIIHSLYYFICQNHSKNTNIISQHISVVFLVVMSLRLHRTNPFGSSFHALSEVWSGIAMQFIKHIKYYTPLQKKRKYNSYSEVYGHAMASASDIKQDEKSQVSRLCDPKLAQMVGRHRDRPNFCIRVISDIYLPWYQLIGVGK